MFISSSSGSRGGGEIFLLYLGQALQAQGHTVALWASSHPRMDELARRFSEFGEVQRDSYHNTYDHWHRGVLPNFGAAATARRLAARWQAWAPDVIHLNKQNLEDANDLLAAVTIAAVPHLCTVHITQSAAFLGARFAAWRDTRARAALRTYPGPLVAVAPTRAAELAEFVGKGARVCTIMNGVSPLTDSPALRTNLRSGEGFSPDAFAIVAVGRLEPQKNPLRFLHYATVIREVLPNVALRWIGGGRMTAEWDRELAARHLAATVQRIEWREDVRSVLPAYDAFLHTAAFEGLPLAILEAMEACLPCFIEKSVHAQLPGSLQSCAVAIDDRTDWAALLGDRNALADLGRRARAIVRAEFSTTTMAQSYANLYQELCAGR